MICIHRAYADIGWSYFYCKVAFQRVAVGVSPRRSQDECLPRHIFSAANQESVSLSDDIL